MANWNPKLLKKLEKETLIKTEHRREGRGNENGFEEEDIPITRKKRGLGKQKREEWHWQ